MISLISGRRARLLFFLSVLNLVTFFQNLWAASDFGERINRAPTMNGDQIFVGANGELILDSILAYDTCQGLADGMPN